MPSIKDLLLRLRAMFFRRRVEEELNDELEFHLQMQARKNQRRGLDATEADRQARLRFGSVTTTTEECRDERRISTIDIFIRDVHFGFRMLRKSPSFSAVAVLTLALAIGANAVVFAALNAFILHPLNLPRAESLYSVHRVKDNSASQSYPDYLDLRDRNHSFEDLAGYNIMQAGLDSGGGNPTPTWLLAVSGNYFDVLGIQPEVGRVFRSSDEQGANSAPYIVISHAYWHNHFQEDPDVLGRVVQLNKHPFTIVGVTPPGFRGTLVFFAPDFFVPMVNQEQITGENVLNQRGERWIFITMGHLKPGVTLEQAGADFNSIWADLEKTYPNEHGPAKFALARPGLYGEFLGRPMRAFLTGLMLLAGLILLAACANLGSLFAARAADRSREVALRLALGATRGRVLRQLFTEALLISLIGGAVGLFGSLFLLDSLSAWRPIPRFPVDIPLHADTSVYLLAFLLTIASGFLFGSVPVRQILRTDPYEIVKAGSIVKIGRRLTVRDTLLVVQIAICAVLVTSSMVAVRGLGKAMHSDFGFDPQNALLMDTVLDMAGYRGDAVPVIQRRIVDAMNEIPGVSAAGLVHWTPLSNGDYTGVSIYNDQTTDLTPSNAALQGAMYSVSPGYFQAAGTRMTAGRDFSWHDDKRAPNVAVINREFAVRMFGSEDNAMGNHFKRRDGTRTEVIGVVENGKYQSLTEDQKPAMFVPILQEPNSETTLVLRSERDTQQLTTAMQTEMRKLDSGLPIFIETWNRRMDLVMMPSRAATVSLGLLGAMGAMLSITGVFGMAAYAVSKRKRELGIRIALGADRKEVLQAALGHAVKLLGFGSIAGLVLGILASRVLALVVYQATPRDPLVLAGVVLAMLFLGLLATWIPAQRALAIDPLSLLRDE